MHLWNMDKTLFIVIASSTEALKKIKLSSANKRFEMPGLYLAILMGVRFPASVSFFMSVTRPSATKRKR